MTSEQFSQYLSRLRLSATEAAQLLSVSARTVRRWLDGEELPGPLACALCGRSRGRMKRIVAAVVFACLLASLADAQEAISILPDLAKTPGKINPAITVEQLRQGKQEPRYKSRATTECAWMRYGIPKSEHSRYRLDHSIPLELGGVSNSCDNLWPQPVAESYRKDCLEDVMAGLVRRNDGSLSLAEAQREMATDWRAAYTKYGVPLCSRPSEKKRKRPVK